MRKNLERDVYLIEDQSPQASQETKSGPWLFLIMIYDLVVENAPLWKYEDIPLSQFETFTKGELSNAQLTTDRVTQWSLENRVWLSH